MIMTHPRRTTTPAPTPFPLVPAIATAASMIMVCAMLVI
jgi:hypothetical protein